MAFNKANQYGESLNILDSEVGLVTKTHQATKAMAGADGMIKAGALFTEADKAVGVVLLDYDMKDHEKCPVSVVVQGRLKADKVSTEVVAKAEDFAKQGLYIV